MVWNRLTVQIIQSCVQSVISSFGEPLHADRDYVKEGIPILTRGSPLYREDGDPGIPILTGSPIFYDTGLAVRILEVVASPVSRSGPDFRDNLS